MRAVPFAQGSYCVTAMVREIPPFVVYGAPSLEIWPVSSGMMWSAFSLQRGAHPVAKEGHHELEVFIKRSGVALSRGRDGAWRPGRLRRRGCTGCRTGFGL